METATAAKVRYSIALLHLLLVLIIFISHDYYICYSLVSMYKHQCNAPILSHVILLSPTENGNFLLYPNMFKK